MSSLAITSSAFQDGAQIPQRYTCDGENVSPPLAWTGAPSGTAAYALLVEDPDAPGGTFIHWVIYDIPPTATSLRESIDTAGTVPSVGGARRGKNGFNKTGYGGPCPPPGSPHHYHFRLFALDTLLGLAPGASRDQVLHAMKGHERGTAEIVGVYGRKE